jgi:hypothetical protein
MVFAVLLGGSIEWQTLRKGRACMEKLYSYCNRRNRTKVDNHVDLEKLNPAVAQHLIDGFLSAEEVMRQYPHCVKNRFLIACQTFGCSPDDCYRDNVNDAVNWVVHDYVESTKRDWSSRNFFADMRGFWHIPDDVSCVTLKELWNIEDCVTEDTVAYIHIEADLFSDGSFSDIKTSVEIVDEMFDY